MNTLVNIYVEIEVQEKPVTLGKRHSMRMVFRYLSVVFKIWIPLYFVILFRHNLMVCTLGTFAQNLNYAINWLQLLNAALKCSYSYLKMSCLFPGHAFKDLWLWPCCDATCSSALFHLISQKSNIFIPFEVKEFFIHILLKYIVGCWDLTQLGGSVWGLSGLDPIRFNACKSFCSIKYSRCYKIKEHGLSVITFYSSEGYIGDLDISHTVDIQLTSCSS